MAVGSKVASRVDSWQHVLIVLNFHTISCSCNNLHMCSQVGWYVYPAINISHSV